MSKKYKYILFDYDGTLIDTNQRIIDSWDHMYQKHYGGHLTGDDVKWTFGMLLWDAIDEQMRRMGHRGYDVDELVASYREYQIPTCATPAPPFEGVIEAVKELKARGAKLAIVTSRGRNTCIAGLEEYGILDCFDAFVVAESTNIHKPLPEPALIALRELGAVPEESIMVGDSVYDLQCGNNAGCDSCFVTWSYATPLELALAEGHPTIVIDTPAQLLDFV